jgi:creatinine amidohydrolase
MRVSEMNWMMAEEYLKRDDRAVLPLGSTEQHAYLSLSVDSILAERLSVEAAEAFGVPVFPVLAYDAILSRVSGEYHAACRNVPVGPA